MKLSSIIKHISPSLGEFCSDFRTHSQFADDGSLMSRFVSDIDFGAFPPSTADDADIHIIVTPWMYTAVPWYAISLALLLQWRGVKVTLIWDDLVYDDLPLDKPGSSRKQNHIIGKVLTDRKSVV